MFTSPAMEIENDWIDYNGHLNMAYYHLLFDRAGEAAFEKLGLGAKYAQSRAHTNYTAEVHVCYVRELHLGDKVTATFQLLQYDEKRIRFYQELRHIDGWLAATAEQLTLHVDMAGPKVTSFPSDILANLKRVQAGHLPLGMPERAGRSIGIKKATLV